MAEPTIWRFKIPSVDGLEGWGDIVMRSDGYFAAVSDYGNYSYRWTAFGEERGVDFRQFFLGLDSDYVRRKLDPTQTFDLERTAQGIREHILSARKQQRISKEVARYEWGQAHDLEARNITFEDWVDDTNCDDGYEFYCESPSSQIMGFVTRLLPRIKEAIRADLEKPQPQHEFIVLNDLNRPMEPDDNVRHWCIRCGILVYRGHAFLPGPSQIQNIISNGPLEKADNGCKPRT